MRRAESGGRGTEVRDGCGSLKSAPAAIRYVVDEQGDYPMAVFEALDP